MSLVARLLLPFLFVVTIATAGLVAVLAAVFLYLEPQIPDASTYRDLRPETPLRILSRDGRLIAEFGQRRVIPMRIEDMPDTFVQAVLNTEDKRFYDHIGVDPVTLAGTTVDLVLNRGEITRGGSTITMQLARQISLSLEQRFIRKFKEILLALKLERELTKNEILELYLNLINFGKRAYGAEAAATTYYGKSLTELTIAQHAMLAGIPQRPTANNPINGPEAALKRRDLVLWRMLEQDTITEAEYKHALAQPITAGIHERPVEVEAHYAAEWIRRDLVDRFGSSAYRAGLVVHTTIDSNLQTAANTALQNGLVAYDERHGYRGPEGRASMPASDPVQPQLMSELAEIPERGGMLPGVVGTVEENRFSVALGDGRTIWVERGGWRWARPYVNHNRRGPAPRTPAEVVQGGDLVRVRPVAPSEEVGETSWRLAQIPDVQGALVSMHPDTGAVDAYVGGYNFFLNQFDHARQSRRQPGSGIKPFIYATALNNGLTPSSIFLDAPLVFEDASLEDRYRPKNSSGNFRGPTRLREALFRSINLVTMRVVLDIGPDAVLAHLPRFGFDVADFPRDLQLAVGGGTIGVTPFEMANAYAILANGGYRVEPHVLSRIEGDPGRAQRFDYPTVCPNCLNSGQREPAGTGNGAPDDYLDTDGNTPVHSAEQVIDPRDAFIMSSMLRDVVAYGTARRARALERNDLAGKTGTTNAADVWFNGYQRNRVTSVWMGFDANTPLGDNEFGSNGPLPIWIDFMRVALEGEPEAVLPEPNGIVRVRIDPSTGQRARAGDPSAIFEIYRNDAVPPQITAGPTTTESDEPTVDPYDLF